MNFLEASTFYGHRSKICTLSGNLARCMALFAERRSGGQGSTFGTDPTQKMQLGFFFEQSLIGTAFEWVKFVKSASKTAAYLGVHSFVHFHQFQSLCI